MQNVLYTLFTLNCQSVLSVNLSAISTWHYRCSAVLRKTVSSLPWRRTASYRCNSKNTQRRVLDSDAVIETSTAKMVETRTAAADAVTVTCNGRQVTDVTWYVHASRSTGSVLVQCRHGGSAVIASLAALSAWRLQLARCQSQRRAPVTWVVFTYWQPEVTCRALPCTSTKWDAVVLRLSLTLPTMHTNFGRRAFKYSAPDV